jgi:NADH-quinone oxidoreductase subunit E
MKQNDFDKILTLYKGEEGDLIPILHEFHEMHGFLSEEGIEAISRYLRISENQIYGVASFYSQCTIKVCMGTACHVRGSKSILDEFKRWIRIEPGETTDDKLFTLETVNCLGACALGPIVVLDAEYHGLMKIKEVEGLIQKYRSESEIESDAVI